MNMTNDFNDAYCIGTGGYGFKIHSSTSKNVDHTSFLNEVRTLTNTRHRNIVKLFEFYIHARHSFLIYEYLEKGSLRSILSSDIVAKELDWLKRVKIVRAVANGLAYMHHECSPSIIHRDISGANILLDSDYEAHIYDFGTSKLLKLGSSNWTEIAGTYGYIAPGNLDFFYTYHLNFQKYLYMLEPFEYRLILISFFFFFCISCVCPCRACYTMVATEKCDVYSFGVVALEVIMEKHPGELITSLPTLSVDYLLPATVGDSRILPPTTQIEKLVKSVLILSRVCLNLMCTKCNI
ncbi:putative protein kinase RLK-Pelle-LRR-XI-1 family [Helianthus anomalus]